MKTKILTACLLVGSLLYPTFTFPADWIIFAPKQKNGYTWFYDKQSVVYPKNKSFIGITTPMKDASYQKMWIKASSDKNERTYQVEIDCNERIARMFDNNGKGVYNLPDIDYLYERPIPPDTVLDMLHKAVCK